MLTIKDLKQQIFSIEIELSENVRALKEKIEKEKGADYPAADQVLLYAGKILRDEVTLDSYKINDQNFLVIMVKKNTSTSTTSPQPTGAAITQSTPATQSSLGDTVGSTLPALEEPSGQTVEQSSDGSAATEGGPDPDADPLNFLRSQPDFVQRRPVIRSNPALLEAFLQETAQTNPQLLQVIQQNQEGFWHLLNEEGSTGGSGNQEGSTGGSGNQTSSGNSVITVHLSPQDEEAIKSLSALGNFPTDLVIQAYFACEKNVNLAAEFLLSQNME